MCWRSSPMDGTHTGRKYGLVAALFIDGPFTHAGEIARGLRFKSI